MTEPQDERLILATKAIRVLTQTIDDMEHDAAIGRAVKACIDSYMTAEQLSEWLRWVRYQADELERAGLEFVAKVLRTIANVLERQGVNNETGPSER